MPNLAFENVKPLYPGGLPKNPSSWPCTSVIVLYDDPNRPGYMLNSPVSIQFVEGIHRTTLPSPNCDDSLHGMVDLTNNDTELGDLSLTNEAPMTTKVVSIANGEPTCNSEKIVSLFFSLCSIDCLFDVGVVLRERNWVGQT